MSGTETLAVITSCSMILVLYGKGTGELTRVEALESHCPESRAPAGRDTLCHGHSMLKTLSLHQQEEEAAGGETRLSILFFPL